MRNALALLMLVSAAASAHASDREQRPVERPIETPEHARPCKCARPKPVVSLALVGEARDAFHAAVLAHVETHRLAIGRCLARSDAKLVLAFKRNATTPRVSASGSSTVSSCLERIKLDGFTAAPRAMSIQILASTEFRR
jgi:hypothetical protein